MSLMMVMLFMQHEISINCNKTYEDVYEFCQLKHFLQKLLLLWSNFALYYGVTLATESSMYVWSRTQKSLPYLLLVIMRLNHGISSCLLQLQRKTELALWLQSVIVHFKMLLSFCCILVQFWSVSKPLFDRPTKWPEMGKVEAPTTELKKCESL